MFFHSLELDSRFVIVGKMSHLRPCVPHFYSTYVVVDKTGEWMVER